MKTIGYLNGEYVDQSQLRIPVVDAGFVLGVTLAEQLRTFSGKPFQVEAHLQRLANGISTLGWQDRVQVADFPDIVARIVTHNRSQLSDDDDLGVTLFVTPGTYSTYTTEATPEPTIGVHSYPLPFRAWSKLYQTGQALEVVDVRQVSSRSWPAEIKCRSRMHYYLASQQARQSDPRAAALLLDEHGNLSETPIANVVLSLPDEGLVSPSHSTILPGISLRFLQQLADDREIPFVYRNISAHELPRAEEILLTSTPYCVLPVTQVNGQAVGQGQPGPIFSTLIQDWSESVRCDIVRQATKHAARA